MVQRRRKERAGSSQASHLVGQTTLAKPTAICCLLLSIYLVVNALPHKQVLNKQKDTDTSQRNLSDISAKYGHQTEHYTSLSTSNPDVGQISKNDGSLIGALSSTTSAAQSSAASDEQPEDDFDAENTTLLIDYGQQFYRSSSSEAPATGRDDGGAINVTSIELLPDITTTVPSLAEPLLAAETDRVDSNLPSGNDEIDSNVRNMDESKEMISQEMRARSSEGTIPPQRDMRDARMGDKVALNTSEIFATLFKKKPYSKHWSVEQKWDDIFKRFMAVQGTMKTLVMKNFLRDIEYYADVHISQKCADDLRFIQSYTRNSTNLRWLAHMFDSIGKSESGMLTGNLANLGHVVQCIKVRAPARPSNDTFNERYFDLQAATLGERFRGKYCLASLRPVMPEKPRSVSRFSEILNPALLSNISYMGAPVSVLKQRATEASIPDWVYDSIDKSRYRLDQIPFESELFQYLIGTRNFVYSLPRFMGVCYPSSCSKDDIRYSIQKSVDDQHQVVDIEFECEVEESDAWEWFTTPRLVIYLLLALVASVSLGASLARHILVDRLQLKRRLTSSGRTSSKLANLIDSLDLISMDKCAGVLFIKTKPASPIVDKEKVENNRSTSIDALKGFLMLVLVYSELVHLGCLPVPFMWSKWSDAMFPFFRAYATQSLLNVSIWSEAFYIISAYLISLKLLENYQTSTSTKTLTSSQSTRLPPLSGFVIKRYIRLLLPMLAFMMFSYVWPRLSNGYVMQDQASKILAPCDDHGWINLLMFHNHAPLNETCLWPTHVSASFFQLHLLSYPIIVLLLLSLKQQQSARAIEKGLEQKLLAGSGLGIVLALAALGLIYPALQASGQELIVPILIDYLDFDNYQRVIEWTVMPTHNHLTSYMTGILLAYVVAMRSRARRQRDMQPQRWNSGELYMLRDGSLESVESSSASCQELNLKPAFMFNKRPEDKLNRFAATGGASTSTTSTSIAGSSDAVSSTSSSSSLSLKHLNQVLLELALIILLLASVTASYFWNGLGKPMTSQQTFWYMIGTKLAFNSAFASLFYRHFATRANSANPWIITRFLVPIGRMSLMLFYVSWPVIWFDLLASLYQWHPSHYFVFEKYNEIIFMSLIISMLAYGAFEGTVKIVDYRRRTEAAQLRRQSQKSPHSDRKHQATTGFDNLFQPTDWDEQPGGNGGDNQVGAAKSVSNNQMFSKGSATGGQQTVESNRTGAMVASHPGGGLSVPLSSSSWAHKTKGSPTPPAGSYGKRLSIADQYKLNAELRANYSFASIGLYESAGATDDLPASNRSEPDPQASPGQAGEAQQRHF